MIGFYDVSSSVKSFEGTFWILGDDETNALFMNRRCLTKVRLTNADITVLSPISLDIVIERLKYYKLTPLDLIKQAEEL